MAAVELADRLRVQRELAVVERRPDPLDPLEPCLHARLVVAAAGVDRDLIASSLLGVVHREVGVDQHPLVVDLRPG